MRKRLNLMLMLNVFLAILLISCSAQQEQSSLERTIISVSGSVPGAPYSSGILVGNTLYCSGSIGVNTETNELGDGITEQTRLVLTIIKSIVEEAGFEMKNVVKSTVFLKNIDDYAEMNNVYRTFFPTEPPARETVAVAEIVRGALVEISCIAVK